jgi:electron transfer flavoprotein beta subunit
MKIMTFVKHVPTSAVTPRIAASHDRIESEGLSYEVNEVDLYAIEEALFQKSLFSGATVAAACIGPSRAKDALHVALAKGVDQVIHVVDNTFQGTHSAVNVFAAAQLVRQFAPNMVFCGVQAEDDLQGQFGASLAKAVGFPVVTAVTNVKVNNGGGAATVIRELGAGYKEEIEVDLPCVLTIQFGIRPLRYTPIMSIVRMRTRPIETIELDGQTLPPDVQRANQQMRTIELRYPEDKSRCQMINGAPDQAADQLMHALANAGVL